MNEINLFRTRMIELEPLAYIYDRHEVALFRVAAELYREYKAMYEAVREETATQSTLKAVEMVNENSY